MEDDYDEYRRWDGDVDVEVSFVKLNKLSPILYLHSLSFIIKKKFFSNKCEIIFI